MKKLIFIFERRHYYESDDQSSFALDYYRKHGIEVEVWSAVYWTFGEGIAMPLNVKKGVELIYINNKDDLIERLNKLHEMNCFFVVYPYHAYTVASYIIRKEIRKAGFEFCNLTEEPDLIELDLKPYTILRAVRYHIRQFLGYGKHFVLRLLRIEKREKEGAKYTFFTGFFGPFLWKSKYNLIITKYDLNTLPNKFEIISKRNIIFPHTHCYDVNQIRPFQTDNNIIVFVDEFECGHSDWEKHGLCVPIQNKELYYKELNHFFSLVEKKYNSKVIIAAHPKAEYKGDEFNGREICYYQTKELIRDSRLVLYMCGTCLTYIILFNKPFILFCTSEALKGHPADKGRLRVARLYGADILQISMDYKGEDIENRIQNNKSKNEELAGYLGVGLDCSKGIPEFIFGML